MSAGHDSQMSNQKLVLILCSTVLFGFITGSITYLQLNTGGETPTNKVETVSKETFLITARSYGACERTQSCPQYKIDTDGVYIFTTQTRDGVEKNFEDTLTKKQFEALQDILVATDLNGFTKKLTAQPCPAEAGGLSERYTIHYEGTTFEYDTCVHDIQRAPLFDMLRDYFVVFTTLHSSS
jgi:hypothetical protein